MKSKLGKILAAAYVGVGVLLSMQHAEANQIIGSGTGLVSPGTTLTFGEVSLPLGTFVTTQYQAFGVDFNNLFYFPQPGLNANVDNQSLANFPPGSTPIVNPIAIKFTNDVNAAAFAFITNPGTSTFTALLNGVIQDSFTASTEFVSLNNYYGFTGFLFDEDPN